MLCSHVAACQEESVDSENLRDRETMACRGQDSRQDNSNCEALGKRVVPSVPSETAATSSSDARLQVLGIAVRSGWCLPQKCFGRRRRLQLRWFLRKAATSTDAPRGGSFFTLPKRFAIQGIAGIDTVHGGSTEHIYSDNCFIVGVHCEDGKEKRLIAVLWPRLLELLPLIVLRHSDSGNPQVTLQVTIRYSRCLPTHPDRRTVSSRRRPARRDPSERSTCPLH